MSDYLSVAAKNYKRLRIEDFFSGLNMRVDGGVLPASTAAEIYNFDFSSGVLRDGLGFSDYGLGSSQCERVWRFYTGESDFLMMSHKGGSVCYAKNGLNVLLNVTTVGEVFATNYSLYGKNVIIICSEGGGLTVWDGVNAAYGVLDAPKIKSLAQYEGLAFIVDADGRTVRYIDDPDPTAFAESLPGSGSLQFSDGSGRALALMTLVNNLYVFREFGISRISMSGGEPKTSGLFAGCGRIFPKTVVRCGGRVLFLSEDGLYQFDGVSAKRILPILNGMIAPDINAVACWSGGHYRLACRSSSRLLDADNAEAVGCESGEFTNNLLISFDPDSGEYSVSRGMDITCLTDANGMFFAISGGRVLKADSVARYLDKPLEKCWRSGSFDLGSERVKVLKEIHLETAGEIVLSVTTEKGSRCKTVSGSTVPQIVRFGVRGRRFSLSIKSNSPDSRISRLVLVYYEI